ncbi:Hypothetical protein PACV_50 [Pacmanvirus A23]|uniref:Hypothetical protein n=1 Tax=Pacmanvirus A23 TaxID=1932881 RepID=UPI000A0959DF|nr:Hypothetical protein B9W72_gp050 [Pacmanvirus A23]SIP85767.1 Hypothetical protein PACV_50 [Pacmanvirus A23]
MPITGGVSRRGGAKKQPVIRKSKKTRSKQSRKSTKSSKSKRASRKLVLPRTAKIMSRKSKSFMKPQVSKASSSMDMTELQFLAKSRGIPWGGLTKTKLVKKINNYY